MSLLTEYGKSWIRIRAEVLRFHRGARHGRKEVEAVAKIVTAELRPFLRRTAQRTTEAQSQDAEGHAQGVETVGMASDGRTLIEAVDAIGFRAVESIKIALAESVRKNQPEDETIRRIRRILAESLDAAVTLVRGEVEGKVPLPESGPESESAPVNREAFRRAIARKAARSTEKGRAFMARVREKYGEVGSEKRRQSLETMFGPEDLD